MEAAMAEAGGMQATGMAALQAQHEESQPTAVNLFKNMVKGIDNALGDSPRSPPKR